MERNGAEVESCFRGIGLGVESELLFAKSWGKVGAEHVTFGV